MKQIFNIVRNLALVGTLGTLTACNTMSNMLNPFYEPPSPQAMLGEMSDKALYEGGGNEASARAALESMATYRRSHLPEPADPVMYPSVVRLMWIPDHLNKAGDLVPAHYYYLRVLKDRPAVTDAFELEQQLNDTTGKGSANSNLPYVLQDEHMQ